MEKSLREEIKKLKAELKEAKSQIKTLDRDNSRLQGLIDGFDSNYLFISLIVFNIF